MLVFSKHGRLESGCSTFVFPPRLLSINHNVLTGHRVSLLKVKYLLKETETMETQNTNCGVFSD